MITGITRTHWDGEGFVTVDIAPEDFYIMPAEPASLSNADLLAAYQRTDGEPGNPEADALAEEIERRGLDI